MTEEQTPGECQAVKTFCSAVLKRKPVIEKMSGTSVNYAIVRQLQDDDIPRLVQMVLLYKMGRNQEAEELAKKANLRKWGEYVPAADPARPKFRRRALELEAFQWKGPETAMPAWMAGKGWAFTEDHLAILIPTLEGTMRASQGDWIVLGTGGEIHPVKPDKFEQLYEPVE